MSALAALLLATILQTRLDEARALAAEGKIGQAIETYQSIVPPREKSLQGDDEIAALTAVNELAALLIAEGRAEDALRLYTNIPRASDFETQKTMDYSAAITAAAASQWRVALDHAMNVASADPHFASVSKLLVTAFGKLPPEDAGRDVEYVVRVLAGGGLAEEARQVLDVALRGNAGCGSGDDSRLARAVIIYAGSVKSPPLEQFAKASCKPVREIATALTGVFADDPQQLASSATYLLASSNAPKDAVKRLLKHRAEDAVRDSRGEYALAANVALMRSGLSETSPIEVAYFLSQHPNADPDRKLTKEVLQAAQYLLGTDRAAVHLHLGHAAAARHDTFHALEQWSEAYRYYDGKPVPMLMVAAARTEPSQGSLHLMRQYYFSAATDCDRLQDRRCLEQVLGEAYARRGVDLETARRFGVDEATLLRNAPKKDEP